MPSDSRVEAWQQAIAEAELGGWLLYDFRGTNPLARSVLDLTEKHPGSRRWFYLIPAEGEPLRIVHGIETDALSTLPGELRIYRSWRELHEILKTALAPIRTVAMEYAPYGNNPYVSRIDGGTLELIRTMGPQIVSSGDLIQRFESQLNAAQWQSHLQATEVTTSAFEMSWKYIAENTANGGRVAELDVRDRILEHFESRDMTTYAPPLVARQPGNRLPHYETGTGDDTEIRQGDLVMIDMWCKSKEPGSIYSDLTRMGYVGAEVPDKYASVFEIVIRARDTGVELVRDRCASGESLAGWEVDAAVREVIASSGYGSYFLHRTGHSLGREVHGNGAHLDDFEMREERLLLPGSLFTIEPGIYMDTFGLRSEINVFIDESRQVHVTGGPVQTAIQTIV